MQEVTDYILAWKTGGTWPIEPSLTVTNIEDYVTRAGSIWKGGELYIFKNSPVTVAPLWWTNAPIAPAALTDEKSKAAAIATTISVRRGVGRNYSPNFPVPVTVNVTPSGQTRAYVVVEVPPGGWTVRNVSHDGRWDDTVRKIKWGPFFDEVARTLTYEAVPPPAASGAADFSGRGSFDGLGYAAEGPLRLWPTGQTPAPALALKLGDSGLTLDLQGEPNRRYELEYSEILGAWTLDRGLTLEGQGHFVLQLAPTEKKRFFRLRLVD